MLVSELLDKLRAHGCKVTKRGQGWVAQCPAHEDRKPSLSISSGASGRILLNCHAGCAAERIVLDLGLSMTDLFEERQEDPEPRAPRRIVATYLYTDAAGSVLYRKHRYVPKDFRYEPSGVTEHVLYRLHELTKAIGRVFLVEGEDDADRLAELGVCATTAGGAKDWRDEYAAHFAGLDVVVLPDNDEPGRKYADHAVTSLIAHPDVLSVTVLPLPGLGPKEDVSDWIRRGGTAAKLLALAEAAEPKRVAIHAGDLVKEIRCEANLPRIYSPWPKLDAQISDFRARTVTVINGGTGSGKTAFACQFAADHAERGPVIYWAGELTLAQIAARIISQRLRVSWRHVIDGEISDEAMAGVLGRLNLWLCEGNAEEDPAKKISAALRRARRACEGTPLIIADYAQLLAEPDEKLRTSVMRAMRSLEALVKAEDAVAVVLSQANRHGGKLLRDSPGASASDYVDVGAESSAIEHKAANVFALAYQQDDDVIEHEAVLAISKARFGTRGRLGMMFHGPSGTWSEMEEGKLPISTAERQRRGQIVARLREATRPLSKNEIRQEGDETKVKGSKPDVMASIDALVKEGIIFKTPLGKYVPFEEGVHSVCN